MAKVLQMKERCSILEGVVETIEKQIKSWGEKQAQVYKVETFFGYIKDLLEAFASQATASKW